MRSLRALLRQLSFYEIASQCAMQYGNMIKRTVRLCAAITHSVQTTKTGIEGTFTKGPLGSQTALSE